MGYRGGALADLATTAPIERFARRTTRKVGEFMREVVAARTPVAKPFEGEGLDDFTIRRGREPGTLRRSWKVGEVVVLYGGARVMIDVYTEDRIAPFVEWDTKPHLIVPRDPKGVLHFETERGPVWAKVVHHPGTRGVHMMATAVFETAARWRRIAEREWDETARTYWEGGGPP